MKTGDTFKVKGVKSFVNVASFDDDNIEFNLSDGYKRFTLSTRKFKEMILSGDIKLISRA